MSMKESSLSNEQQVFDARGNGDGDVVPTITGDHNAHISDYTAIVYDGANITSPQNASNPKAGDPCHTLSTDSRNYMVYDSSRRHDYQPFGDVSETVQAAYGTGGNNVPMVLEESVSNDGDIAGTLDASYYKGCGERAGVERTVILETDDTYQDTAGSLMASGYNKLGTQEAANDMYVVRKQTSWDGSDTSPTLTANNADGSQRMPDKENFNAVIDNEAQPTVRRLTPLECMRLQGLPDGWLDIGEWTDTKGKLHKDSDAAKYRACGNGIALPFWEWLAERICAQYDRPITMASLFDGTGSFPLVFSRHGATPVWASEIEEFCIAVSKRRFPENEEE